MILPSGIRMNRIVIIGVGGIGSWVALAACRMFKVPFVLVDPDVISHSNLGRQLFSSAVGYKVEAFAETVRSITGYSVSQFATLVTENNASDFVNEGDVVFVCPDNHAARRAVAVAADSRTSIAVFTAGNEVYNGNCHCFIKKDGVALTRDLRARHPDVWDTESAPPSGPSCTNLIDHGNYQVLVTNMAVASLAMDMFFLLANCYAPLGTGRLVSKWPQDGWVDMLTGNHRIEFAESDYVAPDIVRTIVEEEMAC